MRKVFLIATLAALLGVRAAPHFEVIKPDQTDDFDAMMDLAVEIGSLNIYFAVMLESDWTGNVEQRKKNVAAITGVIKDLGQQVTAYVSYQNTEFPGVFAVVSPQGLEALYNDERVLVIIYGTLVPTVDGEGAEWVHD